MSEDLPLWSMNALAPAAQMPGFIDGLRGNADSTVHAVSSLKHDHTVPVDFYRNLKTRDFDHHLCGNL